MSDGRLFQSLGAAEEKALEGEQDGVANWGFLLLVWLYSTRLERY